MHLNTDGYKDTFHLSVSDVLGLFLSTSYSPHVVLFKVHLFLNMVQCVALPPLQ